MKKKKNESWQKFLHSKFFLLIAIIFVILLTVSLIKEIYRRFEITKETAQLEQQIALIESKNQEMTDLIDYLNSSRYQEKEIKQKFNMQSVGEKVIFFSDNKNVNETQNSDSVVANEDSKFNNILKWYNYFNKNEKK